MLVWRGVILSNQLYYITIKPPPLSVAAVLLYTSLIFIMLFSAVLFQEKITKIKVLSFVMAFTGCMLVSGIFENSAVLNFQGMAIGLCSGVGYALYTIFSRYAINYGYPSLTIQFYTFVIAAVVGVFLQILTNKRSDGSRLHSSRLGYFRRRLTIYDDTESGVHSGHAVHGQRKSLHYGVH